MLTKQKVAIIHFLCYRMDLVGVPVRVTSVVVLTAGGQ